ncbi:hypothetical protein GGS21DRAFT_493694 [Xylaria nigripes]|nr:hypothetical protein GGS21DRAFT_493694 [Xylaria nigripes]
MTRYAPVDSRMPLCKGVDIEEASVDQLERLRGNNLTAKDLTERYLDRIWSLNTLFELVLIGAEAPGDTQVVKLLREAGAVLLGSADIMSPEPTRVELVKVEVRTIYQRIQIILPAGRNGVVGSRPVVGLPSRQDMIPESHNIDTVDTFGRTVADAAGDLERHQPVSRVKYTPLYSKAMRS